MQNLTEVLGSLTHGGAKVLLTNRVGNSLTQFQQYLGRT